MKQLQRVFCLVWYLMIMVGMHISPEATFFSKGPHFSSTPVTCGGLGQPMANLGKPSGGHLNQQAASPGEVEKGIAEVLA